MQITQQDSGLCLQLGVVESDAREVVAAEMEELLQAKREQVDELQEQVESP